MNRFKKWILQKRFLLFDRFKVFAYTFKGRKYLTIMETGWNGEKWSRRFEIKEELDDNMNPIQFKGKEAIRF